MTQISVVMHAHSSWSYDGRWSLAAIARLYGSLGVNAVMMTEHDTGFEPSSFSAYRAACAAASTHRCTLIPGIEYSSPANDIHILTWGLRTFLAEHRPVMETLVAVREQKGVAVFAHPARRDAWRAFDTAWVPYLAGIELWNRKSDGIAWGEQALELIRKTGLPPMLGQDFHRLRQLYPLIHKVSLPDGCDLEPAIITALSEGTMEPRAFGVRLLRDNGVPSTYIYPKMQKHFVSLKKFMKRG